MNKAKSSLAINHPHLEMEWNTIKNKALTPYDVTAGSNKKVWWQCSANPEHEWEAVIFHRSRGVGCPFCSGKAVSKENSLSTVNPLLASEWHPVKNNDLTPHYVTEKSNKKVWWQCPVNPDHEWMATISNRSNGTGCPYCAGKIATPQTSLRVSISELASEWHPTKNGDLTPDDATPGSNKKIWWITKEGFEFEARIADRARKYSHSFHRKSEGVN